MKKQQTNKVPAIKDFKGMSIINNLMYFKEELKKETNTEKKVVIQRRFDELKAELHNYKVDI
jgi:hypothetical protein